MEWIEPDFAWKSQFVLVLVRNIAGHQGENGKRRNNNKYSSSSFDHDFVYFTLSDFFVFPKLKENYPHVVSYHVGSDSGD